MMTVYEKVESVRRLYEGVESAYVSNVGDNHLHKASVRAKSSDEK